MAAGLDPTPLWFQAPRGVVEAVMRAEYSDLGPDFLCFETFYQAVSMSWPHDYSVHDVGGYSGIQGWLFSDFRRYVAVDLWPLDIKGVLPHNGRLVTMDGEEYVRRIGDSGASGGRDLFVCSAVPDGRVQDAVKTMPNHVVWYPSEEMSVSGPFGEATRANFERLRADGWSERMSEAIWDDLGVKIGK